MSLLLIVVMCLVIGFLCHIETDWLQQCFKNAKRPVLTIKPLAAGRLHPQAALPYVWNTLRECDMVTVGTMSKYEAEEIIEMSLAVLEARDSQVKLQMTRSKKALVAE